jgi:hypothetical protein
MVSKIRHLFAYDFKYKVHSTFMQNVCKNSCGFKENYVFNFFGIKPFHQLFPFPFQSTNLPFHLHYVHINNHNVVHWIDCLVPIKPNFVGHIIVRVQSQSNEPMVTKDLRTIILFWSFSLYHNKDFLDEIFYNMLPKIHIIFSIHHIFCINFSWITKNFFKCTNFTKFFILFWKIILISNFMKIF